MTRIIAILLLIVIGNVLTVGAQEAAAPNWVSKVQKSLLSVATYDQAGNPLRSGTAFYISTDGDAVADYSLFKGAYRAVVTDASRKTHIVERILGADDTYGLVKFRVADVKKATPVERPAAAGPARESMVFVLKYSADKIKNCPSARISEVKPIADECPYYTLTYAPDETYVGAPVFNASGAWVATLQPSMGLNGYAVGAEMSEGLSIRAITSKVNNLALESIHIPKGLPDTAEEALVYLYIKSQTMDNDEYLDVLNLFITTYPDNAEGYSRRATLYIDLHRFDESNADLQTYIRLSGDKAVANAKTADIIYTKLLYQSDVEYEPWTYDTALGYIDAALGEHPDDINYRLQKAQILMGKRDYSSAYDIYRQINSSPDRSASTLYAASLALEAMGDTTDMQILLMDSAIATFPTPLPAEASTYILRRGQLYANAGRYREAVGDYNQYVFLNSQKVNHTFYYDRARLELNAKMFQQSLDDLNKAISLAPNVPIYYIEKCALLLRVNELDDCIQTARQVLRLAPNNADAYRIMGYAQIQKGDKTSGRQSLEQAVKLGDTTAQSIIDKYLK